MFSDTFGGTPCSGPPYYIVDRHARQPQFDRVQTMRNCECNQKRPEMNPKLFLKICSMSLIYNQKTNIFWICRLFYKLHTYIRIFWYGTTFKILAHCNSTLCTPQERNSRLLSTSWKKIAEAKKSGGRRGREEIPEERRNQLKHIHIPTTRVLVPYENQKFYIDNDQLFKNLILEVPAWPGLIF